MDWPLTALSVVSTLCAIAFGFTAFHRNKRADGEADGKESGIVLTEIGYIKSGVDDIKRKQEKQDSQYVDVVTRLAKVEASAAQAHKRLDNYASQNRG